MYRSLRIAHAWSGVVLSVLLAILGVSGTLLVFKNDYLKATIPEARGAPIYEVSVIGDALEAIEARYGAGRIGYVSLAHDEFALHKIVFRDGSAAYAAQDGAVVKEWGRNASIEDWTFHLHHYLFMGETGKTLAGIAGIAAVVMTVTGVILCLPLMRLFFWRVWPRSAKRRDLVAHHRDLGLLFAAPILVLTLTGAAMVFYKPASAFLALATASKPIPFAAPTGEAGDVDWRKVVAHARRSFPDGQIRLISWPRAETAPASARIRLPEEWHPNGRTYVYVDPKSGALLAQRNGNELSRGERASNAIYPLHAAAVGGRLYDFVSALSGLALTALGLIGSWTYLGALAGRERRRRRVRRGHGERAAA